MDDQNLQIVSIEEVNLQIVDGEENLQIVAPSTLYVPDSCEPEGSITQQIHDARREDEVNSQEAIDKSKTSTDNTNQTEKPNNIKKKKNNNKNKRKRTSAQVGKEQVDTIIKNGPGKENQTVDEEQVTPEAKRVKVATSSTPSLELVEELKPNVKPRSSSGTGITWSKEDELTILRGLITFKKEKGEYNSSEFYDDIKSKLSQGTLYQVRDKVGSFRRKYVNGRQSHEMKVFNLSRMYWGEHDAADKDKEEDDDEEDETVAVPVVDVEKMNDGDDESKSEIVGVLRRGLLENFQREGFDPNWAEEQDMKDMENKYKAYKIAEAKSDLAKAIFNERFYSCASKAIFR